MSAAFADIGYHIEDGYLGYAGDTHQSFKPRAVPSVAHIKASAAGNAALDTIKRILRERQGLTSGGQSTTRRSMTPAEYYAIKARYLRGYA